MWDQREVRSRESEAGATALGGLIALAAAIGIGRFAYTPILPAMVKDLGLDNSAAGLIASANYLGYLLGAMLAAWPELKGSRRTWLLGSLATSTVTTAGMGLVQSMPLFLMMRFIGGGASAVVLVVASAVVLERLAEARRAGLSALHFAGVGSGIALSAALVAALAHSRHGWQSLWWANGMLSLAATTAVPFLLGNGSPPAQHARPRTGHGIDPALLPLVVAYGLFGFGYVITATFLVAIVGSQPTIRALGPIIWVVFGLAAIPSVALWTWIAARIGIPAAFAVACTVEAGGVLADVAWPTGSGACLAAVLVGGTFMGLTALGLVRARSLASGDPRRVLALMTSTFGLGQIVGPGLAGVVSDWLGSFTVPSAAAAAALLFAGFLALR